MSRGRPRRRLDVELVRRKLVSSRSQAEHYIKLGRVKLDGKTVTKAGWPTPPEANLKLSGEMYVSRAALKLASVSEKLKLDFTDKIVLDVGSSTGGFTEYALQHGAKKVIAVDVGTNQLHPKLRGDERIELHEKTDIRDMLPPDSPKQTTDTKQQSVLSEIPDMVLIDVSFISLRLILPAVAELISANSQVIAMVKPQFQAGDKHKHKGVVKNDTIRRKILKDFEVWVKQYWHIAGKADAEVSGTKGNRERFYSLKRLTNK